MDRFFKTTVDPSVFVPLDELQPSKLEKQLEKWAKELISVRKVIKGPTMTGKSGTNDSDIYNFVKQGAIKCKSSRSWASSPSTTSYSTRIAFQALT
jgi:hypothetical protein